MIRRVCAVSLFEIQTLSIKNDKSRLCNNHRTTQHFEFVPEAYMTQSLVSVSFSAVCVRRLLQHHCLTPLRHWAAEPLKSAVVGYDPSLQRIPTGLMVTDGFGGSRLWMFSNPGWPRWRRYRPLIKLTNRGLSLAVTLRFEIKSFVKVKWLSIFPTGCH